MGEDAENESYETPPKKMKTEWSKQYSTVAVSMMERMGYSGAGGLGKANQGREEPVAATQQDGRRGLGLKVEKQGEGAATVWDSNDQEIIQIPEPITWLSNVAYEHFTESQLRSEMTYGERPTSLDNETLFCDADVLHNVISAKNEFDTLSEDEKRRARARSNPFETIRSLAFLNRAAVKMANINAMCGFLFTEPKDRNNQPLVKAGELLYFADICAGPGGFSEYILSVKQWRAKGFGFTLRGSNDFKLDKFLAGAPESFDTYYGVQNDGDIYVQANQDSLRQYIFKHTAGVHVVMADGGFSVDGNENMQEVLSKQLYLCQFLTALKILREDGSFVCKLFDLFTPFSIGLVYLMYKSFAHIAIIKPNSSRPANSERYLVCKCKNANTDGIIAYLDYVNAMLNNRQQHDLDVVGVVHLDMIMQDEDFLRYVIDSNNTIGTNQIIGLRKFAAFARNPNLRETRQSEIRMRCIEAWGLKDKMRQAPMDIPPELFIEKTLGNWSEDRLFDAPAHELNLVADVRKSVVSIYDWHFVPIGRGGDNLHTCAIFMRNTRQTLLRYNEQRKWEAVPTHFNIPAKSIFYAEIVEEYIGEGRMQVRVSALHIIDAIVLGGIDIRKEPLYERNRQIEMFAKANSKPYNPETPCIIRAKRLRPITELNDFFNTMRAYTLKNNDRRLGFELVGDKYFIPGGLLFMCNIVHTWMTAFSKRHQALYYHSCETKQSIFKEEMDAVKRREIHASFRNCFQRRLLWKWVQLTQVEPHATGDRLLYRKDIIDYLASMK